MGSLSCRHCFSHFGSTASPYSHHPKPGLEENEQPAPWGERKMKWILVSCLKAWNNLHCCNCSRRDSQKIPFNISAFCLSSAGSQDVFFISGGRELTMTSIPERDVKPRSFQFCLFLQAIPVPFMFFLHTHICLLQSLNHLWHTWPFHTSAMEGCKEKNLYLQQVTVLWVPRLEILLQHKVKQWATFPSPLNTRTVISERNNSLSLFCQIELT